MKIVAVLLCVGMLAFGIYQVVLLVKDIKKIKKGGKKE